MRTLSREEQRLLDSLAAARAGVPTLLLMEQAATAVAEVAEKLLEENSDLPVSILVGQGNNGGDGYAAARLLAAKGHAVTVYETEAAERAARCLPDAGVSAGECSEAMPDEKMPFAKTSIATTLTANMPLDDALLNRQAAANLNLPLLSASRLPSGPQLIIDCVFGTGLRADRPLPEDVFVLFEAVANIRKNYSTPVLAVDVPSGVDADTGRVVSGALKATHTVTFVAPKPGLLSYPGREQAGEILVRGLGLPESFIEEVLNEWSGRKISAITSTDLKNWCPERPLAGHKGTFGRALIFAGSMGMTGAGVLATDACLQSGTGLVTWAVPENVYTIGAASCPQALVRPLPNDLNSRILSCKSLIPQAQAVLVGPGSAVGPLTRYTLEQAIRNARRLVIDADGLTCLAEDADLRAELAARSARQLEPAVLTPHPGEFLRLFPSAEGFPQGRPAAAEALAEQLNSVVVLKGAGTVVAIPSGLQTAERLWVNTTGGHGLAKGGSGDVLAGLMTGLLAQNLPLGVAVCGAVYLHGLAGDMMQEKVGARALRTTDLPNAFSAAFARVGWEPDGEDYLYETE